MTEIELHRGDIVLVASDGLIAWLIRKVSRKGSESPTYVNHAMLVTNGGTVRAATVIDAQPPVVSEAMLRDYAGHLVAVYRSRELSDFLARDIVVYAMQYHGAWYGLSKIVLHLLGLQRFARFDRWPICSWVVARPYDYAKRWTFGKPANEVDPDDIYDYCEAHPEKWECVTCGHEWRVRVPEQAG